MSDEQPPSDDGQRRPHPRRIARPHPPVDPAATAAERPERPAPPHTPASEPPPARADTARSNAPPTPHGGPTTPIMRPDLDLREVHRGSRPGDTYVRVYTTEARARPFRRRAGGVLEATEAAIAPRSGLGRAMAGVRRILVGAPLPTAGAAHERLTKVKALAVLSSDALSSSAYATDEILLALLAAGYIAFAYALPVSFAIAALLIIVVLSYRQTIRAYPQGGGSYIVSRDNLGTIPGLVAGSSLMIGYVVTVSVSVAAGVAAIISAVPELQDLRIQMAVTAVILLTLANLRGVREAGTIFAVPTYLFITSFGTMIAVGLFKIVSGDAPGTLFDAAPPQPGDHSLPPGTEAVGLFLILRAFASGATALTGVEAIADGVPAFKPPEWKNARVTVTWMAVLLTILFLGITFLASRFGIVPSHVETVPSQIGRVVFGEDNPFYYVIQAGTALILILAANTAFADFPRLAYFLARDKFLPHAFMFRGDRLAFSNGILALGGLAITLLAVFNADTHRLIPLYAVGVFTSFTLSQASMAVRWWRLREPGWRPSMVMNVIGAVTTAGVAVIAGTTKFTQGAWMVMVMIVLFVLLLQAIHRHYSDAEAEMALPDLKEPLPAVTRPQTVIVPVPDLNRAGVEALSYARSISPNVTAVHVTDDLNAADALRARWQLWAGGVPLVIIESPYRSFPGPLLRYLDEVQRRDPEARMTVVLTEYVPKHLWEHLLHRQSALRLKAALLFRPNTVVIDVPYHPKL